jgi:cytidylate kinase
MTAQVIAIDGPSGSGKSTVTQIIAEKLGLLYLDTGAMFRAIAYGLKDLGIDYTQKELSSLELAKLTEKLSLLDFQYGGEDFLVKVNGEDLTQKIRQHEISKMASDISKFPIVRTYLADLQRKIGSSRPSILEGRDIGTVIFPDAGLKFFLTASSQVRAERRFEQLKKNNETLTITLEQIKTDIEARDLQDSTRATAPLKQAEDAFLIDSSDMSIDAVINFVCEKYKEKYDS